MLSSCRMILLTVASKAVNALETAQVIVGKATPRLEGLQQQLEGLSTNEALLEQAEIIEDLHARLGGHRKALQDRPHLEAEGQQLLTDADSILKEIRPDLELKAIEQLRPIVARRQSIAELGSKNAVLNARVEQAKASLRETEKRLKSARKERDEIPESGDTDAFAPGDCCRQETGGIGCLDPVHSESTYQPSDRVC